MICLAVTYVVKPGREEEAVQTLRLMSEYTRQEPGNLLYIAHRSPSDPRRFFLYEQYVDQAAVDAHRNSTYFQRFLVNGLFQALESRTPEVYEPL